MPCGQIGLGLLLAIASVTANALMFTGSAVLNYDQEVDPSNPAPSTATGVARLFFDSETDELRVSAKIIGIILDDITFANGPLAFGENGPFHIHFASQGVGFNGDIVVPFPDASFYNVTDTGFFIAASVIDPLFALIDEEIILGGLYFNLHTLDYTSGEIRGQISGRQLVAEPGTVALFVLGGILLFVVRKRSDISHQVGRRLGLTFSRS